MNANTWPLADCSRGAFEAYLGVEQMAEIDRLVAGSPDPAPDQLDRLRRIWARAVDAHRTTTAAAEAA